MPLTPRSALDVIWARINEAIGDKIAAAADSAGEAEKQAGTAATEADRAKTEADRARAEAAAEVDKLKAGAPEAFDTLKEISDELERNETDRAALATTIGKKADKTYVDAEFDKKADKAYVDAEFDKKADKAYVDTEVGKKADQSEIAGATSYITPESAYKLVNVSADGHIRVTSNPTSAHELTRKGYVDTEISKAIDALPSFVQVSEMPADPEPNTFYFMVEG